MTALAEEKRRLRRIAAERIASLPEGYLGQAGAAIGARVAGLPAYRTARTVLAFAGTDREIDTRPLLERVLSGGKILALPVCVGPGIMEARQVTDLAALRPGAYGILEPPADAPCLAQEDIDLILVPCAACDRAGHRLGRGGGYYDRYLAAYGGNAVLLCPEALVTDAVPHEAHDRAVPIVVTECGVFSLRTS